MINKLTLSDAVSKVYGKNLIPAGLPISDWQLFMPFIKPSTGENVLVKLLEVPAYLYTSEQICNKKILKFHGILHQVKFIFIERCFQSSYYLLIAEENLMPIGSILKIKKQAGEKVDESLIFDYIDFIDNLHSHPDYKQLYFTENDIGITKDGKLILSNYLLYFQDQKSQKPQKPQKSQSQKTPQNIESQFMKDAKNVLVKIVMCQDMEIGWVQFYDTVEEKYGVLMRKILEGVIKSQFCCWEVQEMIKEIKKAKAEESFSATITDTYVEEPQKMSENFMNVTGNTNMIDESFQKIKKHKQSEKRKKIIGFIILFILILVGIGAITFKYLTPKPLDCQQNQYADQNQMKCLNCDLSCQSCSGAGNMMCTSCKPTMFLILKNYRDKVGRCGEVCHGTIIKTSTCIDNH